MSPQVAHVLYCVEIDTSTQTCTQQAWLPAPSLLPPMSEAQALVLLGASLIPLCTAWGFKLLGRSIRY